MGQLGRDGMGGAVKAIAETLKAMGIRHIAPREAAA
jgi:hypothetical protein